MDFLVHHLLRSRAEQCPDQEALVDGTRRLTYQALWDRVAALTAALRHLGLGRFDRVAVQLPASVDQVVAMLATSAAGGVFVPLHASLFPRQVAHILHDCQPRILITEPSLWQRFRADVGPAPSIAHIILSRRDPGLADDARIKDLSELCAASPALAAEGSIGRDLAAILYTSGSTGRPKGVMLSHANLVAGAAIVSDYLSIRPSDRILAVLPFSFDAGLNQLTTAFQQGATLVLRPFLLAKQIVQSLQSEQITGLAGVPTLWNLLAQSDSFHSATFPHLRYITNTGGALPAATLRKLRQTLPQTDVFLMYGLTEAFRSTYLPPQQLDQRPGSIGRAIPDTEILVIDSQGRRCRAGEVGELVHHGPTVSLGYWNQPELSDQMFRPHPFPPPGGAIAPRVVYSGDLVYADEEGYLFFVGRRDNQIKTSGFRVSPTEVEEVLHEHHAVAHAAVVGSPDTMLGEAIHAFVVLRPGLSVGEEVLREFCAAQLPAYMVPKQVHSREALPVTASGKIDYPQLRAALTERRADCDSANP